MATIDDAVYNYSYALPISTVVDWSRLADARIRMLVDDRVPKCMPAIDFDYRVTMSSWCQWQQQCMVICDYSDNRMQSDLKIMEERHIYCKYAHFYLMQRWNYAPLALWQCFDRSVYNSTRCCDVGTLNRCH